ncbi:hypothetical protein FIBSPDRAFT_739745 [Athelia psychrophila]|uniref:Uncharacterized protein n=1 Tax=Athelia psychrophila TaxID=1759441 RepID=A0A166KH87_9AGAM|nr:hypothetical protein FIBSPDRAFT_739745 [Fibularhizoctonia sp. CBS 109695]
MPHLRACGVGTPSTPAGITRIVWAEWTGAQVEDQAESLPPGIIPNDDWELEGDISSEDDDAEPPPSPILPILEGTAPRPSVFHVEEPQLLRNPFGIPLIPDHKRRENSPDPFRGDGTTTADPFRSRSSIHPDQGVYMLYALVAWLHTQFHLPFRACNAMLVIAALIIQSFGIAVSAPVSTTLPTVLKKLGVEPAIRVHPVCPKCLEVYPDSKDTPAVCPICQTNIFKTGRTHTGRERTEQDREPELRYATRSLASQMAEIVSLPGMEDELDEWRKKARKAGEYDDFFDGAISRELKGHDNKPFFANDTMDHDGPDHELRVGVTLGADWFSYLRSQISSSHTSGPISFNIVNLAPHHRYRTANLLLDGVMPGPREQDPDQTQRYMRLTVNQLLDLWENGIMVRTHRYPEGRLLRVALVGICCDKPAAHKLGGFGSHSHTYFCTRCWITKSDKPTPAAFEDGAFPKRTNCEHREKGNDYANLKTAAARAAFVTEHAVRWSEFARLPYFDIVRMVVIDPMHNLLLGLVKTHFYHIWVQGKVLREKKELRGLHKILSEIIMPAELGRLPSLIGIPAGGSLTADQWLLLAVVVAPVAIPQLWHDYMPENVEGQRLQRAALIASKVAKQKKKAEAQKARTAERKREREEEKREEKAAKELEKLAKKAQKAANTLTQEAPAPAQKKAPRKRKKKQQDDEGSGEDHDEDVPSRLHPDDPDNFIKLSTALRLLLARHLTEADISTSDALLREYCTELIELYGADVIRPNHHYAMHTAECVRDYGPLHGFWTFLFERLNKVLKSYKTNNHSGGELETSFSREFHRTVAAARMLAADGHKDAPAPMQAMVDSMYRASSDDRGTVQALARELEEAHQDGDIIFQLSTRHESRDLNANMYHGILKYIRDTFPALQLRSVFEVSSPGFQPFPLRARFYDHGIIRGSRYIASSRGANGRNSYVQVAIDDVGNSRVGELTDVIAVDLPGTGKSLMFGLVAWLIPLDLDVHLTLWQKL